MGTTAPGPPTTGWPLAWTPDDAAMPMMGVVLAAVLAAEDPSSAEDLAVESERAAVATDRDLSTPAARRQAVLDAALAEADRAAATGKWPASAALAGVLFHRGRDEDARRTLSRALDLLEPKNRENRWTEGGNSGFRTWPALHVRARFGDRFGPELSARFERLFTRAVWYRKLTTSNHQIMAATARFLATEAYGPEAFRPDDRYGPTRLPDTRFTDEDPTGSAFLTRLAAEVPRQGPGEWASRPYGAKNLLTWRTLALCAKDPAIAQAARRAFTTTLAHYAPVWLDGHLATWSTRSYPDVLAQRPWGLNAVLWLWFGGPPPARLASDDLLLAALDDDPVPPVVIEAATHRTKPYQARSRLNGWALTTWMTPDAALFSRSPKAGWPKTLGQNYGSGVMWRGVDPDQPSFLWLTCPAADDPTPGSKANPNGIHTHGATRFEAQVQQRGALLSLWHPPTDWRHPYALGFLPPGVVAERDATVQGRLLLHYPTVVVALSASGPLVRTPGQRAPVDQPVEGASEIRLERLPGAIGLEIFAPADLPGATPEERLERLAGRLGPVPALAEAPAPPPRKGVKDQPPTMTVATWRAVNGARLEVSSLGTDRIDGKVIGYERWPLQENPWMTTTAQGLVLRSLLRRDPPVTLPLSP